MENQLTRINVVAPKWLAHQHLLAEMRELARINSVLVDAINSKGKAFRDLPQQYVLGAGHVRFFLNPGPYKWAIRRHAMLVAEWHLRGKQWNYPPLPAIPHPLDKGQTWEPDANALSQNLERLIERYNAKSHLYDDIPSEQYSALFEQVSAAMNPSNAAISDSMLDVVRGKSESAPNQLMLA